MTNSDDQANKALANLRVLHVTEFLQGGIATYMNELLPWQGRHFGVNKVAIVCPKEQLEFLSPASRKAAQLFSYSRTSRDPISLIRLARSYRVAINAWKPSLVHVHSTFAGVICRLLSRNSRVPLIYCPHGWAFSRDDSPLLRNIYTAVERCLQSRADIIISISEHEKRLAVDAALSGQRIKVVCNGLSDLAQYRARRPRSNGKPLRLLFIGRLDRQKGLDWLLECMKKISPSDVILDVIGSTVQSRDIGERCTLPNVRYMGWCTPAQVDAHLDASDAVIVPSRWEGFGLVAIEAMRKGVPLFVSNRGALPEVIGTDAAGWVFDLERPLALRELLLGLDRKELLERGRRGRQRFLDRFGAQRMNEATTSLYLRAIKGEGGVCG